MVGCCRGVVEACPLSAAWFRAEGIARPVRMMVPLHHMVGKGLHRLTSSPRTLPDSLSGAGRKLRRVPGAQLSWDCLEMQLLR